MKIRGGGGGVARHPIKNFALALLPHPDMSGWGIRAGRLIVPLPCLLAGRGNDRLRTRDPRRAKAMLYQLSYVPTFFVRICVCPLDVNASFLKRLAPQSETGINGEKLASRLHLRKLFKTVLLRCRARASFSSASFCAEDPLWGLRHRFKKLAVSLGSETACAR